MKKSAIDSERLDAANKSRHEGGRMNGQHALMKEII